MTAAAKARLAAPATVAATLLVAQHVASKAARDVHFLTWFDVDRLPAAVAAGALTSLLAVVLIRAGLTRFGPSKVVPLAVALNAVAYLTEWFAYARAPAVVAAALYLHVAALGSVLISAFWSAIREAPDAHAARAYVARIATGAAFGGVLGGLLTTVIAHAANLASTFLALGAINLTLVAVLVLGRALPASPAAAAAAADAPTPLALVARTPYLRSIALVAVFAALLDTLVEFTFNAAAAETFHDEASLTLFFSVFYTATNTATFVLQASVGQRVLRKLGLGPALASAPAFASLGLAAWIGMPLVPVALLRAGMMSLTSSTFRSGYEVLFVPLPREVARAAKTVIDVGGARAGDLLGALLITVVLGLGLSASVPTALAGGFALVALWLVRRATQGYVETLQGALVGGPLALGPLDTLDRTTRVAVQQGLDRASIRESIEATGGSSITPLEPMSEQARFAALSGSEPTRAIAALDAELSPALLHIAIPWLVEPTTRQVALRAVRRVAQRSTGALLDVLLDVHQPIPLRAQVARVLRYGEPSRVLPGLARCIDEPSFEIRYQTARTLSHLRATAGDLSPPREEVLAACVRELARNGATWSVSARESTQSTDDDAAELDALIQSRASRSLELVLTLLSLVLEPQPLQLALSGLGSEDESIRATAIELLENVVPQPVRGPLVAALLGRPSGQPVRQRDEIVADLLLSQSSAPRGAGALDRPTSKPQ